MSSIYYADLFRINGNIWMILGHGKSDAARLASQRVPTDDLARDSVALDVQRGVLLGRFDLGGQGSFAAPDANPFYSIDKIAFCVDQVETQNFSAPNNILIPTNAQSMAKLAAGMPYPAALASHVVNPTQLTTLNNPSIREQTFLRLVEAATFTEFVLVPWMGTVEQKAALYV